MKKLILLFLISYSSPSIFATNGELFIKVEGFTGQWHLTVERESGQYDEYFNPITPPDLVFTRTGDATIKADAVYDDNNNGTIDENGNEFLLYYGDIKITISVDGGITKYFEMDYKDCDYSDDGIWKYLDPDVYFRFKNGENQFIWTESGYTENYGDYTSGNFIIWSGTIKDPNYSGSNLSCFLNYVTEVTVRNILDGEDYGELTVNQQPVVSGETVDVLPGLNVFETYSGFEQDIYKFRHWDLASVKFNNPLFLRIVSEEDVTAHFYPMHPLSITYNLEGGIGIGDYQVYWQNSSISYNQPSGPGNYFYAFDHSDNLDEYDITALSSLEQYNTSWQFFNWNDGNINSTRLDEQFTSSKNYTVNYKGILRSDNINSYTNTQRKFVQSANGHLHSVYESLNKIWYEKSTDDGTTWALMQSGQPIS